MTIRYVYLCSKSISFLTPSVLLSKAIYLVKCPEFQALLLLLWSDPKEPMILYQTKLWKLVIEAWRHRFQILKHDLAVPLSFQACFPLLISCVQNTLGQISFTTDIWSDQNCCPFLMITAHWISKVEETLPQAFWIGLVLQAR